MNNKRHRNRNKKTVSEPAHLSGLLTAHKINCSFCTVNGETAARNTPVIKFVIIDMYKNISGSKSGILGRVQFIIFTFFLKQFPVIAHLHNPALIHNNDDIRISDRGKPVRNNDTCSVLHNTLHRALDRFFGACIHI